MTCPAVANDVEMKSWRESHVGFERKRFLLLAPSAHKPVQGKRARQQTNGESRILKPARRKLQRSFQPGAAGLPSQVGHVPFSQAGCLHPVQHVTRAAPIVADKPCVPETTKRCRCDHVDEEETGHGEYCLWQKSYF